MRKTTFTLFLVAFCALTAASQQSVVVPGELQELKGLTRIHVAASNSADRDNIVAEIKKRLPQVTFTDSAEKADILLLFSAKRRNFPKSDPAMDLGGSRTSSSSIVYEVVASGAVIKPVTRDSARRLIEFQDRAESSSSYPERALSSSFAKVFVKSYRKANP